MKRILFFVFVVVCILMSGCFHSERVITVNKDGSGTIVETFMLSTVIGKIPGGDLSFHDPEALKSNASKFGEGVKYVSSKLLETETMKGNEAIYSFDNIANLRITEDVSSELMNEGVDYASLNSFQFNFKSGNIAELEVILPETEAEEVSWEDLESGDIDEQEMNAALEMVRGMCSDMKVTTKIVINGDITDTDADNVNGNEITLHEIILKEVLTDSKSMLLMRQMEQSEPTQMKDLVVDFPGIKFETKDKFVVKFK